MEIGDLSKLEVSLTSGRNGLTRAFLKFSSPEVSISPSTGVSICERITTNLFCTEITSNKGNDADITFSEEGVTIANVTERQAIPFCLSHSGGSGQDLLVSSQILHGRLSLTSNIRRLMLISNM